MKSFTRIMIVFVILSLVTGSFAFAMDAPEAKISTFTISGSVGLSGVTMIGLPGNPVTDQAGRYSATVDYGWTGTVTPTKEGYKFDPASMKYTMVNSKRDNQNYTSTMITLTISGQAGVGGVAIKGLPGNPVTDENGFYRATVDYGWSGTVMPVKGGYTFTPPSKTYAKVVSDLTNQNYAAKLLMLTISDVVMIGRTPIQGVSVSANNGGGSDTTDSQGRYSVEVPYGWSGELTLKKAGFMFDPPSLSFTNVTRNIKEGELEIVKFPGRADSRSRRRITSAYKPAIGQTGSWNVVVIPGTEVKVEEFEQTMEDMRVMLQILDEKFKDGPGLIHGLFTDYGDFFGRDSGTASAIYIQGYGVMFLMEVDFPVVFLPEPQPEQPDRTEESVDPVWQRAREKVLSPQDDAPGIWPGTGPESLQQKVEQLRRDLIETLKHASNIRHLKPDEWVILTVTGWGESAGLAVPLGPSQAPADTRGKSSMGGGYGGGAYGGGGFAGGSYGGSGGGFGGGYVAGGYGSMGGGMYGETGGVYGGMGGWGGMGFSSSAVLTIRAKKSDIDAFAKGEVNFEQFQQQVKIFTY